MRGIELTKGKVALVDDIDFEYLSQWCWSLSGGGGDGWYARRAERHAGKFVSVYMHRVVLERAGVAIPKGYLVDHVNRSTLDNRRSNLRVATPSQNAANQVRASASASGYRGVCEARPGAVNPFAAGISVNGRRRHLGVFPTAEEAARAYDAAAFKYFGDFAILNFPQEIAQWNSHATF